MQMREFKPGESVVSTTELPLKRPIPEYGHQIPRGTRGSVLTIRIYNGIRCVLVGFVNPRYTATIHLYTVFPVQIQRV